MSALFAASTQNSWNITSEIRQTFLQATSMVSFYFIAGTSPNGPGAYKRGQSGSRHFELDIDYRYRDDLPSLGSAVHHGQIVIGSDVIRALFKNRAASPREKRNFMANNLRHELFHQIRRMLSSVGYLGMLGDHNAASPIMAKQPVWQNMSQDQTRVPFTQADLDRLDAVLP